MKRLNKGALLGKITASILASALFVSSVPVQAAESLPIQAADESSAQSAPNAAPPSSIPALSFSSDPSNNEPSLGEFVSAAPAGTAPNSPQGGQTSAAESAPAAVAAPDAALTPTAVAPAAVENTLQAVPELANGGKEIAALEGTPETTAPESLDNSVASGTELAQSGAPRTPLDPAYRKLASSNGSVRIKRAFDKFTTNQIIHNLSFRDTPVKQVIAEIARRGNLNVLIDKSVVGKITGDLHDVTLNEAMDSVLTSAGLQDRQLDNSSVVIGTPNALTLLGLNRPLMRTFRISYASPFEVSQLLWASVFNRGYLPDFTSAVRSRMTNVTRENPVTKTAEEVGRAGAVPTAGGGSQTSKTTTITSNQIDTPDETESGEEITSTTRPDAARLLRGSVRSQTNEGTGFNAGSVDPGSQTIRSEVAVNTDYNVDQNGGGAIVIPDQKNRQVIVVGTQDDINIAEEAIRLVDRRPRQVHIQSSLVELTNQGIRQLGASLNLQGAGASSTVLGGAGTPLVNFLPGLGSPQQFATVAAANLASGAQSFFTERLTGISPRPTQFTSFDPGTTQIQSGSNGGVGTLPAAIPGASLGTFGSNNLVGVGNAPTNGFAGFLGSALPIIQPSIAGVQAVPQSASAFNFLTLSNKAGGRANIATFPVGLNFSLNLVLQQNKAKILANPSVVVNDNTEALITLANEVVHKVTTTVSLGVVSTNVELVKAGVFLNVLPKVADDGFVTLRIRPQVSSPLGGPQVFAGGSVIVTLLNVREVMAQEVRVKDGQTLVIGGLFSEQESATLSKVPYLAESPILGALFRNTIKGRNRTELMLLITPKVVEEQPTNAISEGETPRTL